MRFQFTEDQVLFRDAVRELLEKECPAAHVRAMWESASGRSPELWDKLVRMGVVGLTVPEEHGGLGLDEVDLVLILEETGRAAVPDPSWRRPRSARRCCATSARSTGSRVTAS